MCSQVGWTWREQGKIWETLAVFLEKAMAPHSSTLAWKIPWMEEPGRLQSMGSRRVGHDWLTSLSLFTFMHWRRKWQPTPVFLPGESQGGGAWWAAIYGVAQSRTRLKQLSSSSNLLDSPPPHFTFIPLQIFLFKNYYYDNILRWEFQGHLCNNIKKWNKYLILPLFSYLSYLWFNTFQLWVRHSHPKFLKFSFKFFQLI